MDITDNESGAKFVKVVCQICQTTLTKRRVYLEVVILLVAVKSLYRIRSELEQEGIFITPDWLYHIARRHFRLRVCKETYEREVFGVDEDDAERLKELVRQAVQRSKRRRPSAEKGT
ncbi:MAG: hypothetical protein LASZOEIN_002053 [Candidatus Fervidibacter sp.]